MYTGKLIVFLEHDKIITAVCLQQEGERLRILRDNGSEEALNERRVVHASHEVIAPAGSKKSLTALLTRSVRERVRLQSTLDITRLWEAAQGRRRSCSLPELARLGFGSGSSFDHETAVLAAAMTDRTHFRLNGTCLDVLTPEKVSGLKEKAAAEKQRREDIQSCTDWLCTALRRKKPAPGRNTLCVDLLKSYVTFGSDAPRFQDIREMLIAADMLDQKKCYDFLVKTGAWPRDKNILLERHGIPHVWQEEVRRQAEAAAAAQPAEKSSLQREDLCHLSCYTIDEPFTRDLDDALSFEEDGRARIGIHITDISSCIDPGSAIDREAAQRGASLYLPEGKIPMIPPALSEHVASLKARETRAAVSFLVTLSPDGEIIDFRVSLSWIRVARKLSYQGVDREIERGGKFERLYALARQLRSRRRANGAAGVLIPELQVRVDRSTRVSLKMRERESPSQVLVSECMILANHCAAMLFKKTRCPALYRRQPPPPEALRPREHSSLFQFFAQKKKFGRTDISTAAGTHAGLGLAYYTSVTSPLRKYLDLVVQRQLVHLLKGSEPLYSVRDLKEIAAEIQPVLARAALVEQERKRYWILKLLKKRTGRNLEAVVLEKKYSAIRVLLIDYLLETTIKTPKSLTAYPGDTIRVIIDNVDPFTGLLKVLPG